MEPNPIDYKFALASPRFEHLFKAGTKDFDEFFQHKDVFFRGYEKYHNVLENYMQLYSIYDTFSKLRTMRKLEIVYKQIIVFRQRNNKKR